MRKNLFYNNYVFFLFKFQSYATKEKDEEFGDMRDLEENRDYEGENMEENADGNNHILCQIDRCLHQRVD